MDTQNLISHRLYRQHTYFDDQCYIKDLSRICRDLKKTIIIDNIEDNFKLQPNNGLRICNFEGDANDKEFELIKDDLINIVVEEVEDVTESLREIRRKMLERYESTESQHKDNNCDKESDKHISNYNDKSHNSIYENDDNNNNEEQEVKDE